MSKFLHHNLSQPIASAARGGVIAIGNFDGVHRGHQTVLDKARAIAAKNNVPCYALSFEPHPRTLFRPDHPVFRLTPEALKARVLEAAGIDGLLTLPFTRDLASTSADEFVEQFLLQSAGASHVVTGFNFHFGKDRVGTPEFLTNAGKTKGFGVTIVDAFGDEGDGVEDVISSSRIRRLLGAGGVNNAAKLLGFRWGVSGEVIKGAQLGRTLGFPTANLSLPESCHLKQGIYAVRLRRQNGILYDGVASFGRRPTFDDGPALFETFIFDFSEDIYGEQIDVALFAYQRGEIKFDGIEPLIEQMKNDAQIARDTLSKVKPLSALDSRLNFKP
ncbi:MAG: bifunctional riboflavin kinase/FAD synthetase [Rhizobiaceae bacterium]